MTKLKVTNTKTGKSWTEENTAHSWTDLCLDIMKTHKDFHLVYSDIECLVKNGDDWYMLDECGSWEYLPEEYNVEEV